MKIDLTSFYKIRDANLKELKNIHNYFKIAGGKAISYEQSNHSYQNRTGNLESNTVAEIKQSGDEIEVSLQMNTEYAEYVVNNGFSKIEEASELMEADIENYLQTLGK